MKILIIGCSYSACNDDPAIMVSSRPVPIYWEHSWPYKLHQRMPDSEIYNLSISGGTVSISNLLLRENLQSINPDLVLFQITSSLRIAHTTFDSNSLAKATDFLGIETPVPGFNYLYQPNYNRTRQLSDYYRDRVFGTEKNMDPINVGGGAIWLRSIMEDTEIDKVVFKNVIDSFDTDETLESLYNNPIKNLYLYEILAVKKYQSILYKLGEHYHTYAATVLGAKMFCDKLGYKSIFFDWLPTYKTAKTDVVKLNDHAMHLDRTVVEFNMYESIPKMEMYAYDDMMHLDPEGNELVAQLIYEKIGKL